MARVSHASRFSKAVAESTLEIDSTKYIGIGTDYRYIPACL